MTNKGVKMKKVLLFTGLALLIAFPVMAKIKDVNVTRLITAQLKSVRSSCVSTRDRLNINKSKMQDINTNYGTDIDTADKAKLVSIFSDMNDAIDALDAVGINIDTNFPTIQE